MWKTVDCKQLSCWMCTNSPVLLLVVFVILFVFSIIQPGLSPAFKSFTLQFISNCDLKKTCNFPHSLFCSVVTNVSHLVDPQRRVLKSAISINTCIIFIIIQIHFVWLYRENKERQLKPGLA